MKVMATPFTMLFAFLDTNDRFDLIETNFIAAFGDATSNSLKEMTVNFGTTYQIVQIRSRMGYTPKDTVVTKFPNGSKEYRKQKLGDLLDITTDQYDSSIRHELLRTKLSIEQFLQFLRSVADATKIKFGIDAPRYVYTCALLFPLLSFFKNHSYDFFLQKEGLYVPRRGVIEFIMASIMPNTLINQTEPIRSQRKKLHKRDFQCTRHPLSDPMCSTAKLTGRAKAFANWVSGQKLEPSNTRHNKLRERMLTRTTADTVGCSNSFEIPKNGNTSSSFHCASKSGKVAMKELPLMRERGEKINESHQNQFQADPNNHWTELGQSANHFEYIDSQTPPTKQFQTDNQFKPHYSKQFSFVFDSPDSGYQNPSAVEPLVLIPLSNIAINGNRYNLEPIGRAPVGHESDPSWVPHVYTSNEDEGDGSFFIEPQVLT